MNILDIQLDDIGDLDANQLVELVVRLAEAELAANNISPGYVRDSSGSNAPDGGVDIRVKVPQKNLNTGFLKRPEIIFQVKSGGPIRPQHVKNEMCPNGVLRDEISDVIGRNGSYVIVSSGTKCSDRMTNDRHNTMNEVVPLELANFDFHLEFIDKSRLLQWSRMHPSVCIWIKKILKKRGYGWSPYESWTNPKIGTNDSMILETGVSIKLPNRSEALTIRDAIEPLRDIVMQRGKTTRVVGLSGVGKTRIVQSLFDSEIGSNPLDQTIAIYGDVGDKSDNRNIDTIEELIRDHRKKIIVLDNCSGRLHERVTTILLSNPNDISLITIELEIADDDPCDTELVVIEATGLEISKRLIKRHCPKISQAGATKIAKMAGGNARVSTFLAKNAGDGKAVERLSDRQLFGKIFWQRDEPNDTLLQHAEVLSLVYSFSNSSKGNKVDELAVLASIYGIDRDVMKRSVSKMVRRGVIQKRSNWRAVLPPAISNHLANEFLNYDDVSDKIIEVFEKPEHHRLFMSFCRRLGQIGNKSKSREFANRWLKKHGILGDPLTLSDDMLKALVYLAPIAPKRALSRIRKSMVSISNTITIEDELPRLHMIAESLWYIAMQPKRFETSIHLLIEIAKIERKYRNSNKVDRYIIKLYRPTEPGKGPSIDQRSKVIRDTVFSECKITRDIGFLMISSALGVPYVVTLEAIIEFIESSDHIADHVVTADLMSVNSDDFNAWRSSFLALAGELCLSDDPKIFDGMISIVQACVYNLVRNRETQSVFLEIIENICQKHGFVFDLWISIRHVIYTHFLKHHHPESWISVSENLISLERITAPKNMYNMTIACLRSNYRHFAALGFTIKDGKVRKPQDHCKYVTGLVRYLGKEISRAEKNVMPLNEYIFGSNSSNAQIGESRLSQAFGEGLAMGTSSYRKQWNILVEGLNRAGSSNFNHLVFSGYLEIVNNTDRKMSQEFLRESADHPLLSKRFVLLHPFGSFAEEDYELCVKALPKFEGNISVLKNLIPIIHSSDFLRRFAFEWIDRILETDYDVKDILTALEHSCASIDNEEHWAIVLKLAQKYLRDSSSNSELSTFPNVDEHMFLVIEAALMKSKDENEKEKWVNLIFSLVDNLYGDINNFCATVRSTAAVLPEMFLDKLFITNESIGNTRIDFLRGGIMSDPVLGQANIDELIKWCKKSDNTGCWEIVASGIDVWESSSFGEYDSMSQNAIEFLKAADNPKDVLDAYIQAIEYVPGFGSLANSLISIMPAIKILTKCGDPRISAAARSSVVVVSKRIKDIEKREKKNRDSRNTPSGGFE